MTPRPTMTGGGRRRFLAALGGLASGALLRPTAATGTASPELSHEIALRARTLASQRDTPLRMLIPEGCEANLHPVVRAFAASAGIDVELVVADVDDIGARIALDALSGAGDYDLALPATFSVPDLVAADAIVPLTDYARAHEPAGFRDDMLYTVGDSFDGETYGFQTDGDAFLMFYRRELLEDPDEAARYADRFGETLAVPTTWEALDRQMAFFHRPDEGSFGGALFRTAGYLAWEWWVRFHAKGVWPMSPSLEPQIASDAGVEALEAMVRATEHQVASSRSNGLFENWERFARGDVFCNIGWGGTQKYLNAPASPLRGRLAFGPTPGGIVDGEHLATPYFNWGWNYVVTAHCATPELAYLFALFAATPGQSSHSVSESHGFFDPFRPEHYEDDRIRSAYGDDFLAVHRDSLENAVPDFYLAYHGEYLRVLSSWLDRAIDRRVDPEAALRNAARAWETITPRKDRQAQIARWLDLRAKYPPALARRLRDLG